MKKLNELKDIETIHFVGIGGAGMSPLARIMLELGYHVSGSDREDSGVIENLRRLGAKIMLGGQKAENVRVVSLRSALTERRRPSSVRPTSGAADFGFRRMVYACFGSGCP